VRSTTQRRGNTTKPFMSSDRLTISMRNRGTLATASFDLVSGVAGIGPHEFEPGKALADLVEDHTRPVAILQAGGMDDDPQRQAFNVGQGVELATLHLLAGVTTHCVVFTPAFAPPFSAACSDWLSMMAAVGLASRPRCSRKATSNSSQIRSHTPSR
jgi:hypothetical protein